MANNKVIFVGDADIQNALQQVIPDWDWQTPVSTIQELNADLDAEESQSMLSKESSMIMLFSRLFDEDPESFASTVAFFAPYAAMTILLPDEDEHRKQEIEDAIRIKQVEFESRDDIGTNANTPYYFVSYQSPKADTYEAISKYVKNHYVDEDTKRSVSELIPSHLIEPDFEEFDETEEYNVEDEVFEVESNSEAGQVIAVTSPKGGSGKSTVSIALSAYLSKSSKLSYEQGLEEKELSIVLVDLDTRDGQLGFLTGGIRPNVFNIIQAAQGNPLNEEVIREGIRHDSNLGVDLIYATRRPRHAKTISPSWYADLITNLRNMYDIVILDTSVNYLDELLERVAYPIANTILLVTDMNNASLYGMARWITETSRPIEAGGGGTDLSKVGVVVNKTLPDVNMTAEKIEKAAKGLPILAFLPSSPKLFTYAANTQSLYRVLDTEAVNSAFKNLAERVIEPTGYQLADVPFTQ